MWLCGVARSFRRRGVRHWCGGVARSFRRRCARHWCGCMMWKGLLGEDVWDIDVVVWCGKVLPEMCETLMWLCGVARSFRRRCAWHWCGCVVWQSLLGDDVRDTDVVVWCGKVFRRWCVRHWRGCVVWQRSFRRWCARHWCGCGFCCASQGHFLWPRGGWQGYQRPYLYTSVLRRSQHGEYWTRKEGVGGGVWDEQMLIHIHHILYAHSF